MESIAISEPVLLIRISRTYRPGMSNRELYEATRGVWKLGKRREAARLAFAVYGGTVIEVYEIHEWHPAGTSSYTSRTFSASDLAGRWEFTGTPATRDVRDRYVGASVAQHLPKGSQAPVLYINVPRTRRRSA